MTVKVRIMLDMVDVVFSARNLGFRCAKKGDGKSQRIYDGKGSVGRVEVGRVQCESLVTSLFCNSCSPSLTFVLLILIMSVAQAASMKSADFGFLADDGDDDDDNNDDDDDDDDNDSDEEKKLDDSVKRHSLVSLSMTSNKFAT
jgi:hypothetical protein